MSDKSHVSMEQHICVVCTKEFDTGSILLDRRLRQSMERHTVTGWSLCPEHQKLKDDGFVALVEIDPKRSSGDTPEAVFRLGRIIHIKESAWIFPVPPPKGRVGWVTSDAMDTLVKLASPEGSTS